MHGDGRAAGSPTSRNLGAGGMGRPPRRRPGQIPLGTWAGIPVGANWSVLVTIALVAELIASLVLPQSAPGLSALTYWLVGIGTAVVFELALLVHELTHAIVARHYGVHTDGITLWLLGGMTRFTAESPTPRAELAIAVSGPLASIVVGGVFVGASFGGAALGLSTVYLSALSWMAIMNIVLGVFNLLPGAPLDGGRVLRALLWRHSGNHNQATATAGKVGIGLGAVLGLLGVVDIFLQGLIAGVWLMLLGWFMATAASAESTNVGTQSTIVGLKVRDVMTPDPITAPGWLTVEAFLTRVAITARQRVFPVVDFDLRPSGVVNLNSLRRLSEQDRLTTRVIDAAQPLEKTVVVTPNAPFSVLMSARLRPGLDLALVVDAGHLVGVVSAEDVNRALELAAVGRRSAAPSDDRDPYQDLS